MHTPGSLPDLSSVSPRNARKLLRFQERADEIIRDHCPRPDAEPTPLSPLAAIHIEALAHLTALARLHRHGAQYHELHGNTAQSQLWERDYEVLIDQINTLFDLYIN